LAIEAANAYERVLRSGVSLATNVDLLALLLAREPRDVYACEADALRLADRFKGARILDIGAADLQQNTGLEPFEALQRLAAIELGRRGQTHGRGEAEPINDEDAAYRHFQHLAREKQEHFCAAYLDSKNKPIHTTTVHIGTVNMSVVGPREVFREAVRENAAALVVAHNHPSGDPTPSPEDVAVTRRLAEVGRLLDIPLLDHVIVGHQTFRSMKKDGLL
jgi:DNA repair protein RadC